MKILLFSCFPPVDDEGYGGGAISVWNSIKTVVLNTDYSVTIAYRSDKEYKNLPSWFGSRKGVKVTAVRTPKDLLQLVADNRPDVFHGVDPFSKEAIMYCRKHNIATVYDVHSVECWPTKLLQKFRPPITKNWRIFFANRRDRKVADISDIVIRPSDAAVITAMKNYNLESEKVVKSYNSVDNKIFFPRTQGELSMKIINAGRIAFDRHFKTLVGIYVEIKKKLPLLTLDIAGDGHDRESLEAWVKEEAIQGVKFRGLLTRSELGDFYRSGDILVNTSEMESFGNVVAEAMASGLPVVCFNVGSLPELVTDGVHGFLNDFGDTEAHIKSVLKLYDNPRLIKELGINGREKVCSVFSEKNKAKELSKIYECLIKQ